MVNDVLSSHIHGGVHSLDLWCGLSWMWEDGALFHYTPALFVSEIMFSKKWVNFQKIFSINLYHFPIFGSNLKWVEKQSPDFSYLAYYEIKLFSQKNLIKKNL